jgi:Exoribonuclease R
MFNKQLIGSIFLTSKGEGYVRIPDLPNLGGIFIAHENLNKALHGDTVKCLITKSEEKLEGIILEVLERAKYAYAGIIEYEKDKYYFVPDDKKIYTDFLIKKENLHKASPGDKVVVKIIAWEDFHSPPEGEVIDILGRPGENDAEMLAYALERGFSNKHDEEVKKEAEDIARRGILPEDYQNRRDFRSILTFTS